MKLVTPPLGIKESDGFKNDVLGRETYGKALLNVVTRSSDELVISLDGQWGEGKTTFIRMWQGLLKNAEIPNIYIDAFANDYVDDAFIAVASAITSYAEANTSKPHQKAVADFKDKTKKIGIQLLSWTARLGVKAATLGALSANDLEELKGIKDDLSKGVSGVVSNFVEERLTSHAKDVELLKSFKELLSDLPKYLKKGKGKPLVIIIDELDRCKPTYAVEVIEKIKHLFSVRNVVFVLVINKKQLEESIRCVYGREIDAHIYLQKFVNLETSLPKRIEDTGVDQNDIRRYCHRIFKLHEIETWGEANELLTCTVSLAIHLNLSLRQLEKVFTNIAVFYATSEKDDFRSPSLIAFLCVIKVHNPLLFNDLLYNKSNHRQVLERSALPQNEQTSDKGLSTILTWIKFSYMSRTQDFDNWGESAFNLVAGGVQRLSNEDRRSLMVDISKKLNLFSTRD